MKTNPDIYLRRVTHNDQSEFTALMRASKDLHEPWIQAPTTSALFRYYLQRIRRNDHEGFAICRSVDDAIVGVINVNNIVRGSFLSASLGYYVGAEFHGQGYMQAGLQRLIEYAFNTMGLHRLEANIQPDNIRSQATGAPLRIRIRRALARLFIFGWPVARPSTLVHCGPKGKFAALRH